MGLLGDGAKGAIHALCLLRVRAVSGGEAIETGASATPLRQLQMASWSIGLLGRVSRAPTAGNARERHDEEPAMVGTASALILHHRGTGVASEPGDVGQLPGPGSASSWAPSPAPPAGLPRRTPDRGAIRLSLPGRSGFQAQASDRPGLPMAPGSKPCGTDEAWFARRFVACDHERRVGSAGRATRLLQRGGE